MRSTASTLPLCWWLTSALLICPQPSGPQQRLLQASSSVMGYSPLPSTVGCAPRSLLVATRTPSTVSRLTGMRSAELCRDLSARKQNFTASTMFLSVVDCGIAFRDNQNWAPIRRCIHSMIVRQDYRRRVLGVNHADSIAVYPPSAGAFSAITGLMSITSEVFAIILQCRFIHATVLSRHRKSTQGRAEHPARRIP